MGMYPSVGGFLLLRTVCSALQCWRALVLPPSSLASDTLAPRSRKMIVKVE